MNTKFGNVAFSRIPADTQFQLLAKIDPQEAKALIGNYQERFSDLESVIGTEDTIKLSMLYHGLEAIHKPSNQSSDYASTNTYNKIKNWLGEEVAQKLMDTEQYKYSMCIYLPNVTPLIKTIRPADIEQALFDSWETFTKSEEYQQQAFADGTWTAEKRPLIYWCGITEKAYNIPRQVLISVIEAQYGIE